MNLGENRNVDKVMKLLEKHFFIIRENNEQFYEEKKTKIALNQVFVPKLSLKVKSHKNIT